MMFEISCNINAALNGCMILNLYYLSVCMITVSLRLDYVMLYILMQNTYAVFFFSFLFFIYYFFYFIYI